MPVESRNENNHIRWQDAVEGSGNHTKGRDENVLRTHWKSTFLA